MMRFKKFYFQYQKKIFNINCVGKSPTFIVIEIFYYVRTTSSMIFDNMITVLIEFLDQLSKMKKRNLRIIKILTM